MCGMVGGREEGENISARQLQRSNLQQGPPHATVMETVTLSLTATHSLHSALATRVSSSPSFCPRRKEALSSFLPKSSEGGWGSQGCRFSTVPQQPAKV